MKQKALIVEPTRLFQNILEQIFSSSGIECHTFSSGKEALEADHSGYNFILVAKTLDEITGEIFLQKFALENGLGDALTILLTTGAVDDIILDANKAGYKLVFDRKNVDSLQKLIVGILNKRILEPDANILFIEDTQSVADMIKSLFHENNGNVVHVKTIGEAKDIFDSKNFDLVITDYYLENDETGDDVIAFIRNNSDSEKSQTPILVVSGESNQAKRTSFLRNGANDFIIKPYNNDELLVRSSNLIKNYRLLIQAAEQQQQLIKLALTDQLTGLYNRHSLNDVAPKYVSNAHRHNTPLSLLVIDLDHFKKINDTKGHSVGDIVLQSIANVLQNMCRTEDIVARFGGEEFIMILSNCNLENALQKAESIRQTIEDCRPEGLTVTSSIGAAQLSKDDSFEILFDKADKGVYEAKETGRNKVVTS